MDALVSRLFSSKYKEKYAHHIHPAGMAFAAQRVTRGRGGGESEATTTENYNNNNGIFSE